MKIKDLIVYSFCNQLFSVGKTLLEVKAIPMFTYCWDVWHELVAVKAVIFWVYKVLRDLPTLNCLNLVCV